MTDHFESPRLLMERAGDHIKDLEARIKAFFDRQPYTRIIERDRDTDQDVHKIRLTAKIPGNISTITKDVFTNLRDALDHAVYASAVTIRPGATPNKTAFPFAEDAAGVHKKLNSELTDIPPDIRTFLEGFQPHKTGNQLLFGLNSTRNVKTHRVLVPIGAASTGFSGTIHEMVLTNGAFGYHRWDAVKNEVEYARLGQGSRMNGEITVSFDVVFGDVPHFGGQSAIRTLHTLAREVESVVLGIEAETNRILKS
jgi:hypothetical protein